MGDVDDLNVEMKKEVLAFRLTTSGDKQMNDVEELSMGDVDDLNIVWSQTFARDQLDAVEGGMDVEENKPVTGTAELGALAPDTARGASTFMLQH
jgi:hypothetical protein